MLSPFLFLIFNAYQAEFIKYSDYSVILTSEFVVFILPVKTRNPWVDTIYRFPSLFVTLFLIYLQLVK